MRKFYEISIFVFLFSAAIFFWIKHERKSAKNEIKIEQQKQQIETQSEIILHKKTIAQRQAVARAVSTNDNLVWLRQYRCKDCGESR